RPGISCAVMALSRGAELSASGSDAIAHRSIGESGSQSRAESGGVDVSHQGRRQVVLHVDGASRGFFGRIFSAAGRQWYPLDPWKTRAGKLARQIADRCPLWGTRKN